MRKWLFLLFINIKKTLFGPRPVNIPHLVRLYGLIYKALKPKGIILIKCKEHQMYVNCRDEGVTNQLLSYGIFEGFENKMFADKIKPGDVVLDIGANIGCFTLLAARLAGAKGRVYAFEPEASNFDLLKKNVELNNYHNVTLVNQAAADKNGKIKLYLSETVMGMHRIYQSHYCDKTVDVESVRLDDYFKDYFGKIDFVKIDTEGSEWAVLQGMTFLLQKNKKLKLFTEFAPCSMKEFGVEPEEYLKFLGDHGFTLYHFDEENGITVPADVPRLLQEYAPETGRFTNLFCIKEK